MASELLEVLKRDKIVLDWRKEQATRASVRVAVEEVFESLTSVVDSSGLLSDRR